MLRKLINLVLITDSDLDAFCQDHFPSAKKRFTDGMDRVRKVSLLLEICDTKEILEILELNFSKEIQEYGKSSNKKDTSSSQKSRKLPRPKIIQDTSVSSELIKILRRRADRILNYLFDYHPEHYNRFRELHILHISSLQNGEVIFAHEILREIHNLTNSLTAEQKILTPTQTNKPKAATSSPDASNSSSNLLDGTSCSERESKPCSALEKDNSNISLYQRVKDEILAYFTDGDRKSDHEENAPPRTQITRDVLDSNIAFVDRKIVIDRVDESKQFGIMPSLNNNPICQPPSHRDSEEQSQSQQLENRHRIGIMPVRDNLISKRGKTETPRFGIDPSTDIKKPK